MCPVETAQVAGKSGELRASTNEQGHGVHDPIIARAQSLATQRFAAVGGRCDYEPETQTSGSREHWYPSYGWNIAIWFRRRNRGTPAAVCAGQSAPVAVVNVSVVPMDRDRLLPGQTVVVADGKIAAMVPANTVEVPTGAHRIDGAGKFLMPGLADMHVHFANTGNTTRDDEENQRLVRDFRLTRHHHRAKNERVAWDSVAAPANRPR